MKPLEDVRIISLEQYGAGPFGSLQLADLGAEIIKIEDPALGGDVARYVPPFAKGEDSLFFESFNRNKKSINLDITNEAGREVFEMLVGNADAVYSNLRGDVPEKLRIRYEDLAHCNKAIVCCSLTGFGMTGPRRAEPGYDYIIQGLSGWMNLTGEPGGPPTKSGLSLVDYSGGFVAVIALLAGLHAARRDGVGCDCDLSLYDTAISLLTYPATWHMNASFEPQRTRHSAHPSLVPFQNFETSDSWIVVGCAKEKFWQRLVVALELPEIAKDERFTTFGSRFTNREELLPALEARFLDRTTREWIEILQRSGVPCSPVNTLAEALAEPQTLAREMVVETEHPRFGTVRQMASAVRVGPPGSDRTASRRAPLRNEDADYVFREIAGLDTVAIERYRRAGAFGAISDEGKGS